MVSPPPSPYKDCEQENHQSLIQYHPGLFILADLNKLDRFDVGIYRDDGLSVTPVPPRQAENLKKKISSIFAKHGLGITAQANITKTEFLDIFFDLDTRRYRAYNKPNNTPQYVHRLSNHPPNVLKNIPEGVNQRLSSISSDEEMNRKTIKISYSTTPNMAKIISSTNSEILSEQEAPKRTCNCPKNAACPLNGQCLENNIVYHAKITQSDQKVTNYIGMTSTEFKKD